METNKPRELATQTDSIRNHSSERDNNSDTNSNILECNTQAEDLVKDDQNESLLSKNEAEMQATSDKSCCIEGNDCQYRDTCNHSQIPQDCNQKDTGSCCDEASEHSEKQNIIDLNKLNLSVLSNPPELCNLDSIKMKCLLREFKKYFHKQVELADFDKNNVVEMLEDYVKSCDLDHQAAEDSNNTFYSNCFKISFYLSLVIHPLMCFSNSKFAKFLEDQNCLTSESPALLVINDIIFKLTTERLIRFCQPKENKLLLSYFLDQMSDECRTKYQEEVKILKSLSLLENQHSDSSN